MQVVRIRHVVHNKDINRVVRKVTNRYHNVGHVVNGLINTLLTKVRKITKIQIPIKPLRIWLCFLFGNLAFFVHFLQPDVNLVVRMVTMKVNNNSIQILRRRNVVVFALNIVVKYVVISRNRIFPIGIYFRFYKRIRDSFVDVTNTNNVAAVTIDINVNDNEFMDTSINSNSFHNGYRADMITSSNTKRIIISRHIT